MNRQLKTPYISISMIANSNCDNSCGVMPFDLFNRKLFMYFILNKIINDSRLDIAMM